MTPSRVPTTILAGLALLAPVLAGAVASAQTTDPVFVTHAIDDAAGDTVALELSTSTGFETLQNSRLAVEAAFDGDGVQRYASVLGVLQNADGESCPADNGTDPCFLDMRARTLEDAAVAPEPEGNGDLRADTGPGLDLALETGHDHARFTHAAEEIDLALETFPLDGENATDYHLVVSVPGAETISAELSLVARGDVSLSGANVTDTGFVYWLDDMRAVGTHSAAGNVYVGSDLVCGQGCGEAFVDPDEGQRIYGAIGPSQNGQYYAHSDATGSWCDNCVGPIPAAFTGRWGASTPAVITSGTAVGVISGASPNEAIVTVPGFPDEPGRSWDDGAVEFFVESYVSVGPQDLAAAGFLTPLDPVR